MCEQFVNKIESITKYHKVSDILKLGGIYGSGKEI